jgi:hypothetical protein
MSGVMEVDSHAEGKEDWVLRGIKMKPCRKRDGMGRARLVMGL